MYRPLLSPDDETEKTYMQKLGEEFIEEQTMIYEKEVTKILEETFCSLKVEEELIPFLNFPQENAPENWLLSYQNRTKFANLVRKKECCLIFKNLFFSLNLNNFTQNPRDVLNFFSEKTNWFEGLEFEESFLTKPIWTPGYLLLFSLFFFPIAFLWILIRNFIAIIAKILSWVFTFIMCIGYAFCGICLPPLMLLDTWGASEHVTCWICSWFGVCFLTFFLPVYLIVFIVYTILWTIGEILAWIFAIFHSCNAQKKGSLMKVRHIGDVRMFLKNILDRSQTQTQNQILLSD